jgi:uncharacterized protein
MHTEDNVAFIKAAWGAFASRDVDRIAALFTEDAEWVAPRGNATAVALGASDHMIGRDAIAHVIAREVPRLFHDISIEFRGFYAQGPSVVVENRFSATLPNGASYANDYCFIFECRDGKIALMREYMDTHSGFKQVFAKGDPFAAAS